MLKKKHSKTGEESRYQGTVLGIKAEDKLVKIEGGGFESIQAWEARLREHRQARRPSSLDLSPAVTMSPDSPMQEDS